jgi:tRNA threonylcarbamoyladenosine dehydratase
MEQISSSFDQVVGVGGVGSHAANMLIRSGVRKIRVIDFDQVTLSSLNRHAVANTTDVGESLLFSHLA